MPQLILEFSSNILEKNNAFVHISLKVMPGRSFDTLKNIGENMIELLKKYFSDSLEKLNLQITLEIIALCASES